MKQNKRLLIYNILPCKLFDTPLQTSLLSEQQIIQRIYIEYNERI